MLTRPFQARYVDSLLSQTSLDKDSDSPRKCLRESQIVKSEENVVKIMNALKNDFINPFSPDIEKERLYNVAFGCPLPNDIAENLLAVFESGAKLREIFFDRLDAEKDKTDLFFEPVKRVKWKSFCDTSKKVKVSAKGQTKDITVQRDILLAAKSQQENAGINIDKALCFPLAPVPLSMATSDGMRRKTAKSKLLSSALSSLIEKEAHLPEVEDRLQVTVIDLMALIRSMVKLPNTFQDLALQILSNISNRYHVIYFACETYRNRSIKNSERLVRGTSDKFIIRNGGIRLPSDFKRFLGNGDNKERLFEVIEEVLIDNRDLIGERVVYFARGSHCLKITREESSEIPELRTDHEGADTKIVYLVKHAATNAVREQHTTCVVRSSSGDIDIPIILLGCTSEEFMEIHIDNGTGKSRRLLDMNACSLSQEQKKALVGFHAFTGNDYVPCFFRKGKHLCWKHVKSSNVYIDVFARLGCQTDVPQDVCDKLEEYVCVLYGDKRCQSVNESRSTIFWRQIDKDKVPDLSILPPCKSSLQKHIQRANYVARIWRKAGDPMMMLEDPARHGWLPDLSTDWIQEAYPNDVAELLISTDDTTETSDFDREQSSDSDDGF